MLCKGAERGNAVGPRRSEEREAFGGRAGTAFGDRGTGDPRGRRGLGPPVLEASRRDGGNGGTAWPGGSDRSMDPGKKPPSRLASAAEP